MATTQSLHSTAAAAIPSETRVIATIHATIKYCFGLVPIVAGLDKFTNLLAHWEAYLNPLVLRILPLSATTFMQSVGVIEIVAGVLVFLRPRLGGLVVMAWLLAISAQLLLWGQHLDIAVRDIVMALTGALTLARLSPIVDRAPGK